MDLCLQLDSQDAVDIEADLSLCEKIAVTFLLCQDLLDVEYFLQQQLLVAQMQDQVHPTTMILEWSRRRGSWSNLLIESLCVAQCNHVLLKLGLNLDKLALFHFPTRPEITTHLHPVLKLLYLMCEKLDTASSTELADRIKSLPELSSLDFRAPRMLEIHLLHCISQKILRIFDTNPQIEMLISRFKETDNLDMYDFLRSNVDRIVSSGLQPQSSSSSSMVVRDKDSASITSPMNTISNVTEDDTYQVNKNSPGLLLIINQFTFHTEQDPSLAYLLPSKPLDERRGTEKDVEALQKTFQQFKFDIVIKNDLAHDQILIEITRTIEAMSRASSCLFVAILSHGIEGCVYGSNSIPLEVRDIKNHIYRCGDHLLLGRPKCLIVQACQGQNLQISKPLANNDLQTDSPNPSSYSVAIPPCSDILIAWSTVEGFASLRHVLTGTWFVQTLCQTIGEQFERTHLLDILTLVNNKIAAMKGNRMESMIPKIESTFRKKFFFPR